jgi:hypothetical protein
LHLPAPGQSFPKVNASYMNLLVLAAEIQQVHDSYDDHGSGDRFCGPCVADTPTSCWPNPHKPGGDVHLGHSPPRYTADSAHTSAFGAMVRLSNRGNSGGRRRRDNVKADLAGRLGQTPVVRDERRHRYVGPDQKLRCRKVDGSQ